MQTSDAGHFFRTETDLARSAARAKKAQDNRHKGEAINLIGKIISIKVTENDVWTAEGGHIIRQTCLLTNMTLRFFRGHTGAVSCLVPHVTNNSMRLISGSWDKTIKIWDPMSKKVLSSTAAHTDFVKCLTVIPSSNLLISGGSDKVARVWNLAKLEEDASAPLQSLGVLSGHTRPIDCLAYDETTERLYTGDSMGVIKMWRLELSEDRSSCRPALVADINTHRTGVNSMEARDGFLWSASTDGTVQFQRTGEDLNQAKKEPFKIEHKGPVRCMLLIPLEGSLYLTTGCEDLIHIYDVSTFVEGEDDAQLLNTIDAHADNVTALCSWMRQPLKETRDPDDYDRIIRTPHGDPEPWIVSSSLDGTVRKWRLASHLSPQPSAKNEDLEPPTRAGGLQRGVLTAEDEKELEDLLDSD